MLQGMLRSSKKLDKNTFWMNLWQNCGLGQIISWFLGTSGSRTRLRQDGIQQNIKFITIINNR